MAMGQNASFVHLHVHTEFSMLDGAARIDDMMQAVVSDGMPAVGITDHGNMYGVLDFYKACRQHGIKPVIGTEAYLAYETRFERPARRGRIDDSGGDTEGGQKLYYHLTLLAETDAGYRNLIKLASLAFLEGYYYKPRMDWDLLARHHEGLIATSGCLGGHVLQALLRGDTADALKKAGRLQDIFGRDNFFIELQDQGLPAQRDTNPRLLEIAKRLGAPILATNDSHYVRRGDAIAHDALLCVQTGAMIADPKRFKFEGEEHYVKPAHEMRDLFRELPEACDNTLWIAERADVSIDFGKPQLPAFPLPGGFDTDKGYLEHLTFEGARQRWGDDLPAPIVERLAYELRVIADMGFSSYFLIVWDLIRHARESGIRVGPGRGSAAGCAVAYCLRITDLDPIRYDLLFERFLNPGRLQMPDIDMDFDSRYRDEMIRYAAERYGRDHVAQIVTFSTIKARAAVRDAARVLGYPYALGDKIAKAMPPLVMGRDTPLYACLEPNPKYEDGYKAASELRDMYSLDPDVAKVVDVARGLEGLRRQDGIHAAAVVITRDPLTEYLPVQRKPEAGVDPESAPVVTQYEMHGVEELGLLKMDFLGLRNLDVITDTVEMVRASKDPDFDADAIPLDDDPTLALLRRGDSIGVFQLEGGPMRALMRSLAPTSFDDVAALVALYRPGPMAANMHNDYADRKNGRQPITYLHPDAEEVLSPTYGLCLTGDTRVFDVRTGRPLRLDAIAEAGEVVLQGVDGDNRAATGRVTHWVCNGERAVHELRLTNGMSLRGTYEHPVLTYDGWKPLGSLTPDDRVAVPKELLAPKKPSSADPRALRVLGYLIADGSLTVRAATTFVNKDADLLDAFRSDVQALMPSCRLSESTGRGGVARVTVGNGRGNGGPASDLLRWLRQIGLKSEPGASRGGAASAEKFVPDDMFGLPDDDVARFLAALWDCDGHINTRFAHYKTISRRLAADVQTLLMRLGFDAPIYRSSYRSGRTGTMVDAYQVTVYDGPRFTKLVQPHMTSTRKRNVCFTSVPKGTVVRRDDFVREIRRAVPGGTRAVAVATGIARSHLQPYARRRQPWIHASVVRDVTRLLDLAALAPKLELNWVEVQTVEPAGSELVYDITVEGTHNFVANGLLVHNCVYQEQVMRVAQKFAGYSLAEADNLRKACGKKIRELIAKERVKFVEGCVATGYGAELGNAWFDIIEPFADYAFNKSHSYGYGYIAYQTAYLKAHYPVEYLSCLLTSVKTNLDKAAVYLAECRSMGIPVLVPDINRSSLDFAPIALDPTPDAKGPEEGIVFGLSAVRNVGEGLVRLVLEEREKNGPFTDFYDFCDRVDPNVLNKRTLESLIKAGGFDSCGHKRRGLLLVFEQIIDKTLGRRRKEAEGQFDLFSMVDTDARSEIEREPIPDLEFDKAQRLAFEKEMLGLYVSDHPLFGAEAAIKRKSDCPLNDLPERTDGDVVTVAGVVTGLQRKYTKKGDLMAVFVLEDLQATAEVMVFPKVMAEHGHKLVPDGIVCVRGRVDGRDDVPKIMAMDISVIEVVPDGAPPIRVNLPPMRASEGVIDRLKSLLADHPGESPVFLHLGERQVLRLPDAFCVDAASGIVGELRVLLGADAVF